MMVHGLILIQMMVILHIQMIKVLELTLSANVLHHSRDIHSDLELGLYWEHGTKDFLSVLFWVEVMKSNFKASDDEYPP